MALRVAGKGFAFGVCIYPSHMSRTPHQHSGFAFLFLFLKSPNKFIAYFHSFMSPSSYELIETPNELIDSKNSTADFMFTFVLPHHYLFSPRSFFHSMANFLSITMALIPIPWLLLTQFLILFSKSQAKVPAIIVFGDSSVDAGNNNQIPTIARSNFEPYGRDYTGGRPTGRFSNGRIPTDFISEAFGLKPTVPAYLDPMYNISDFAVGVTFASAGTGYDNATSDVLSVIPLWKELEYYKEYKTKLRNYQGDEKASETLTEAAYIISLGTNDFLENYYTLRDRRSQYTVEQYQVFLVGIARNFVTALYGLGARKISLGGLPPMGCLPLERTTNMRDGNKCVASYNAVALGFNGKLYALVGELNKELPGIKLVFSNPYYVMMQIVQRPSLYGFSEAKMACCATGMFEMGYSCDRFNPFTCTDANKYVFWDAFHPTEKTSRIVAQHMVKTALYKFL